MRTFIIAAALLLTGTAAHAETILASVNGMVCAFCATGLEKTFKKQAAVDSVKVDLEKKLVTLATKPNQTLDDATVTKLIAAAGYTVVGIERK
jgi:copper chaperone CopZ